MSGTQHLASFVTLRTITKEPTDMITEVERTV